MAGVPVHNMHTKHILRTPEPGRSLRQSGGAGRREKGISKVDVCYTRTKINIVLLKEKAKLC